MTYVTWGNVYSKPAPSGYTGGVSVDVSVSNGEVLLDDIRSWGHFHYLGIVRRTPLLEFAERVFSDTDDTGAG